MRSVHSVISSVALAVCFLIAATPAAAQLGVIQSGTTSLSPDAVAYDPGHDAYLLVGFGASDGPNGLFVSAADGTTQFGSSPFVIGSGETVPAASVAYSPEMSDGAGGSGAFLVVWSTFAAAPSRHIYAQAVAFPGQLVGPRILLDVPEWPVITVGVAYSRTDHVFLAAWASLPTIGGSVAVQPFFLRLDLAGQPIGAITPVSAAATGTCVGCGRINVAWNPAVNEFGLLYHDASLMFVRLGTDGTIPSRTSLGPAVPGHALTVNSRSGSYLAAVADFISTIVPMTPTATRTMEIDVAGSLVRENTAAAIGVPYLSRLALSYSPLTNTFLLDIAGMAVEVDEHGSALSTPLNLGSIWNPSAASRSVAPEWMVNGLSGFARLGSGAPPSPYVRGDLTGDGAADLIWQRPEDGAVLLWGMYGPEWTGSTLLNHGGTLWQIVGAADFTGDGKTDLLWQSPSTGEVLLWGMNWPAYLDSTMLTNGGTMWHVVAAADFTGDGKADIVWQMPGTGAVLLWEMDGSSYVSSTILNSGGTYWHVVGAGDFTGDGQTDLLWQDPVNGALLLWAMNGSSYVRSTFLSPGGTYWKVVAAGDYTGDGQLDIVWQLPSSGAVLLWEMDGSTYLKSIMLSSGGTPWQVKAPR